MPCMSDSTFLHIENAAHGGAFGNNTIPEPTEAQCIAGNYKVGRANLYGLPLAIEQPRGSYRTGIDAKTGKRWASRMAAHYGYISGTKGADDDAVDCFIGFYPQSETAYVINQNVGGRFDEHKVMLAFPDEDTARRAYLDSYERGWNGLASLVPASISQLKWWLKNGDLRRPLRADNLPHEGLETMTRKVQWNSDALPYDNTLDHVLYEIRCADAGEGLLMDAVTAQEITEDADGLLAFDALVSPYAKLERKMELLRGVMERTGDKVKPVAMQITEPFKQRGVANVAAIFELSDGQTVSIFFHNPDVTPGKMAPTDEVISWKWLLNKKDITIVVAPERGADLNIREVARRIMRLAEKNSPAFQRLNAKRAERMGAIQGLKDEIAGLEAELAAAQHELEVAKVDAEDAQNKKNRAYADAVQQVSTLQDAYLRATQNGGTDPKTGQTKEALAAQIDSQAVEVQRLRDIANGVTPAAPATEDGPHYSAQTLKALVDSYGWEDTGNDSVVKAFPGVGPLGGQMVPDGTRKIYAGYRFDERKRYIAAIFGDDQLFDIDGRDREPADVARELNERVEAWVAERQAANGYANPAPAAASAAVVPDPTSPEGYAKVMADPALQLEYQDALDSFFQSRSVDIRNAMRSLGWKGDMDDKQNTVGMSRQFSKRIAGENNAESTLYIVRGEYKQVGAGANIVSVAWEVLFTRGYGETNEHGDVAKIADDLSKAPEQIAGEIDAAATAHATKVGAGGTAEIPTVDMQNEPKTEDGESAFVEPSKPFDSYLDDAGGDTFEAAKTFYRSELQGKVVNTVIGGVHMTGSGFKEMKRGMKSDALKARLTASVPAILSAGRYDGKSKPHKERSDGFVAFHFFEKEVEVDSTIVTAGVNVGEREDKRFEYIAYGLNHSENAAWKKREASGGAGNEPASDASPGSVSASLDSILGDGGEGINIVILKVVDKATGKRLTELEDDVGESKDVAGETAMSRIESILSATDGAAKVRYEAGGKVYISAFGDGKQGEMRYVLFYYKGSAGEFLKSYRHGNGLLSDAFIANVQKVEKAFAEAGIAVVDKEGNTTMAPSQPEAQAADAQPEATEGPAKDRMDALKMLTDTGMNVWMSEGQNKAVIAGLMGEEWKFFADKMKELAGVIAAMPKTYDQDGMGDSAVAHLHYFRGAADWYITEKDMEGKGTQQAFGLADLGYGGELGYISIEELISAGVELDFHFSPKTIGQIKSKGEPATQEAAPEVSPEDRQKQVDQALFQSVIDGNVPDILAPELADSLEAAYYRQQTDPALVSLFEQAVAAYQAAMMAATSSLA